MKIINYTIVFTVLTFIFFSLTSVLAFAEFSFETDAVRLSIGEEYCVDKQGESNIVFDSSDDKIFTVDDEGRIVGVAAGYARLTANINNGSNIVYCDVYVYDDRADFTFKLSDDGSYYIITDLINFKGSYLAFPKQYNSLPVKTIDSYAFDGNAKIKSILVHSDIESIGNGAFMNCLELYDAYIEESSKLSSINSDLFYGCTSLNSFVMGENSAISSVGSYAFYNCTSLKYIDFGSNSKIDEIGSCAFKNCILLSDFINTPASISQIGKEAFYNSKYYNERMTSVNSIFKFADNVVKMSPLSTVKNLYIYERYVSPEAFYGCKNLETLTIASSVEYIYNNAFADCEKLVSVSFEKSGILKQIASGAFSGCSSLVSLEIPSSVKQIESEAFEGCERLTSIKVASGNKNFKSINGCLYNYDGSKIIKVPQAYEGELTIELSVTTICALAFSYCSKIEKIIYEGSKTEWNSINKESNWDYSSKNLIVTFLGQDEAFDLLFVLSPDATYYIVAGIGNCTESEFIIPYEYNGLPVKEIKSHAFDNCDNITLVKISPNIEIVSEYAFKDCDKLSEVVFLNNSKNTFIGDSCFESCDNLKKINFPKSLKIVSENAFRNCASLVDVIIEDDSALESIGSLSFQYCYSLENFNFENAKSLKMIDAGAFKDCSKLYNIELQDGLTQIRGDAFTGTAYAMDRNNWTNNVLYINNYLLDASENIRRVDIKSDTVLIADEAFIFCESITEIAIPDSVKYIGDAAFSHCHSLSKIQLSNNITEIRSRTFLGCYRLKEVVLPEKVTFVGDYAFRECRDLNALYFPKSVSSIGTDILSASEAIASIYVYKGSYADNYFLRNGKYSSLLKYFDVPVTGFNILPDELTAYIGEEIKVNYRISPDDATHKVVKWYTSDNKIFTVDSNGYIMPIDEGVATLTGVTDIGSYSDTCNIVVKKRNVSDVKITNCVESLFVGNTIQLNAQIIPYNATDKSVTWKSSDENVLSVDSSGLIRAKSIGTATITVTTVDGNHTDEFIVEVKAIEVATIELNIESIEMFVGDEVALVASILPQNATNKNVVWRSDDTNIVAVDVNGKIYSKSIGITIIRCSTPEGNVSAYCTVKVNICGDTNGDGEINTKDAVLLAQKLAGWNVECSDKPSDCNGDGTIDTKDAVLLAQYLAGWDVQPGKINNTKELLL